VATRLGRNCVAIRKHNRNPLLIYWGEVMADRFSDEPVPTDAELLQHEVLAFYEDWELTGRSKATLIAWLKARPSIAAYITDVIVQHLEEPRKEHLSEVRNPISEQLYSDIYDMYLMALWVEAYSRQLTRSKRRPTMEKLGMNWFINKRFIGWRLR